MKRQEIDLNMTLPYDEQYHFDNSADLIAEAIRQLVQHCHARSYNAGWWRDPLSGLSLIPGDSNASHVDPDARDARIDREGENWRQALFPYVVATKIALIHSEVSEMLEAERRSAMDDKLPEFAGVTAEAGDVLIRVFDLLGMLTKMTNYHPSYDLAAALLAKLPYNASRIDHTLAARAKPGGKMY